MPKKPAVGPPRQARSRDSLRRMLDAAEAMLLKHGPEGATLPRIATHARVSPANVYRRFKNKEALMRAVFRRFNERSSTGTKAVFDKEAVRTIGLVPFSTNMIRGMVRGFRQNAALSRAAIQFAERHPTLDFIRGSRDSEAKSFAQMVDTFLMWQDEIRHPDPEYAIRFAFLTVACLLRELIIFDRMKMFSAVIAVDDAALERELPRVFLRCLGVNEQEAGG